MSLKVATFNVNSIKARKDLIIRWLTEKNQIDILCFQELKCEEKNFPFEDFKRLGYECAVNGQKAYNGVAICSKFPLSQIQKGLNSEKFDAQKRVIKAKIKETTFYNIYAPHGGEEGDEKHLYKLEFFKFLKEYVEKNHNLEKERVCILGDMNVAREDIDVYDPDLLRGVIDFMDDEREVFEEFLSIGLIDLFRKAHPDVHGFTWWDYKTAAVFRDEGMRIDYILASPPLAEKLIDIKVDMWTRYRRKPTPSDHAPVVAAFDI